jgi:hypothetical protein
MENKNTHEADVLDIITFVTSKKETLAVKTILKAIELCKLSQRDNLRRPINSFYDAVYYKANQMHLAGI